MQRPTYLVNMLLLAALVSFSACRNDGSVDQEDLTKSDYTGLEYAPQMYDSYPYEPYKQIDYNPHTSNGQNVKHPAQGVIARGHLNGGWPYGQAPLTDGTAWLAGYEASDTEIQLPDSLNLSGEALAEGKRVYEVFCDHCHGAKGMGDGPISKDEKIIVPSYMNADRMALSYGKMYYSITYGKNAMGQHASQLTPLERWRLVQYVRHLQGRAPEADFQPGQAAAPTMTGDAMAAN